MATQNCAVIVGFRTKKEEFVYKVKGKCYSLEIRVL